MIKGVLVWFMKMLVVVDIDFVFEVFNNFCKLLLIILMIYCIMLM